MASFGQYVHWSWGNYVTNGTFKNTVFWKGNQEGHTGPTNFSQNLFIQHKQNIRARAKAEFAYAGNLKELEAEYNASNQEMSVALSKLLAGLRQNHGSALSDKAAVKALLHLINKSWTDLQLEDIMANLKMGKNGLIEYTGKGIGQMQTSDGKKAFIPKGEAIYIASTLKRCQELRNTFTQLIAEGLLDVGTIDFNTILTRVETALVLMAEKQAISKKIINAGITNLDARKANAHGKLPVSKRTVEQYIINPLNELYAIFSSREAINKILTYRMAEILGELIEIGANSLAFSSLQKVLETWAKTGTTGSTMTTKIDYAPTFFTGFDNRALEGIARQEIKIPLANGEERIDVQFRPVGSDVQQKTDIVFKGQHISMKTTSLQDIEYQKSFLDVPSISLQNSSLLLYLMGIESQDPALGTHYLNILSQHPDAGGVYTTMRQQANRALELYILYSALTGQGQLRSGKMANILAIYEKSANLKNGEPRVKMFSTWDIINKIDQRQGEGAIINPRISSLSFANTWVGPSDKSSIEDANLRISKILVQARNTQISASISKVFLNAMY